jgi:uncharacterized RDD family membrane protein YckC
VTSEDPESDSTRPQSSFPSGRDQPDLAAAARGVAAIPFRALGLARRVASRAVDGVVDRVVGAVDVDEVVRRVDVEDVVKRIDVEDVVKRIDVEDVVQRIDVDEVAHRVDVDGIVARSAGSLPRHGLDAVRRTLVRLDELADAGVGKLVGPRPVAPAPLADAVGDERRGRYAGPISRLAGYVLDAAIVGAGYGVLLGVIAMLWGALTKEDLGLPAEDSVLWILGFAAWAFAYYFTSWSLSGQTIGQSLTGIAVVRRDGGELGPRAAALRVLAYPTIALLVPLIGVVVGRERRALYDVVAGSVVVYD